MKTIHQPAFLPSTSAFSGGSAISTKLDMPHSKNHMKRGENGRGYGCTVPIVRIPRDFIEIKCQAFYPLEMFQHNSSHDLLDICVSVQRRILRQSKIGSFMSAVSVPSVFCPRVDEKRLSDSNRYINCIAQNQTHLHWRVAQKCLRVPTGKSFIICLPLRSTCVALDL